MIITASCLVILVGAGYYAFNRITDYVLKSITSAALPEAPQTAALLPGGAKLSSATEESGHPQDGRAASDKGAGPATQPQSSTISPTGAPDAAPGAPTPYDGTISTEKAQKAEETITVKDKALVASILLKKLSTSDIQLLTKLASGGLTLDEKKEAKKVILQKLSEDEYNELIAIAAKLGLSQGRDYKESQKEFTPEPSATPASTPTPAPSTK